MNNKPLPSPCINICELNEEDVCIGCYRNIAEISSWHQFGDEQKRQVYLKIEERERAAGVRFGDS